MSSPSPSRAIVVVGIAVLAAAPLHLAHATTCGRDADASTVPSPVGVRAPRNVRPRVTLHAAWRTKTFCPPWVDRPCASGRFNLALRPAGRANSEALPIDLRESRSGEIATVEIVPRQVLPASTRFEIVHLDADGKEAPRVVATFATGDTLDQTPPVWAGVTSHRRTGEWGPPAPPTKPTTKGVITIDMFAMCEGQGIYFDSASAATDDQTLAGDLRYGVWLGDEAGAIDYSAPPLAYAHGTLEHHRPPAPPTLVVPFGTNLPPNDFSFPEGKKAVKFGLRAVDVAGNASPPSEIVVRVP